MLTLEPEHRGPTTPLQGAPARAPGSMRRTSTLDTTWPEGFAGPMAVHGRARDLATGHERADVLATSELTVTVAPDRTVSHIDASGIDPGGRDPGDPRLSQLVGASTMRGFRSAVAAALPDLEASGVPLRLLLDDLPGALLVSGFAMLAADAFTGSTGPGILDAQIDVCAGWADGSGMVSAVRTHGQTPTPASVESPPLEDPDDSLGWHELPPLEPISTRRRRLLDVAPDPRDTTCLRIEARFRDSHIGADGVERSFHEYGVRAIADRSSRTLVAVDAWPGVLPWRECPGALASAGRVVGTPLADVRSQVRASFRGTTTCTHLNDVLAAIGDADVLAARAGH